MISQANVYEYLLGSGTDDKSLRDMSSEPDPYKEMILCRDDKEAEQIEAAVKRTGLPYRVFDGTLEEDERYLVFGSFYVVEAFLRNAAGSE